VNRVIRRKSAIGLLDGNAISFVNKIFYFTAEGAEDAEKREKRELGRNLEQKSFL
jgi:hypothetical protein